MEKRLGLPKRRTLMIPIKVGLGVVSLGASQVAAALPSEAASAQSGSFGSNPSPDLTALQALQLYESGQTVPDQTSAGPAPGFQLPAGTSLPGNWIAPEVGASAPPVPISQKKVLGRAYFEPTQAVAAANAEGNGQKATPEAEGYSCTFTGGMYKSQSRGVHWEASLKCNAPMAVLTVAASFYKQGTREQHSGPKFAYVKKADSVDGLWPCANSKADLCAGHVYEYAGTGAAVSPNVNWFGSSGACHAASLHTLACAGLSSRADF